MKSPDLQPFGYPRTTAHPPAVGEPASRRLRQMAWALGATLILHAPPSHADDYDHNQARQAVQAGQILPLSQILARQHQDHPGQVLEVELEREDERWVYELKVLQADGQLLKLELEAQSGRVLKRKLKTAP